VLVRPAGCVFLVRSRTKPQNKRPQVNSYVAASSTCRRRPCPVHLSPSKRQRGETWCVGPAPPTGGRRPPNPEYLQRSDGPCFCRPTDCVPQSQKNCARRASTSRVHPERYFWSFCRPEGRTRATHFHMPANLAAITRSKNLEDAEPQNGQEYNYNQPQISAQGSPTEFKVRRPAEQMHP